MSKVYSSVRSFSQSIGRAPACLVALFIFTAMASAASYTLTNSNNDGAVRTDWSKTDRLQKTRKSSTVRRAETLAPVTVFSNVLVPTRMQLFSSQNSTRLGESVTFTAVVSIDGPGAPTGIQPTGTVRFFDGGGLIGSAAINNGTATLTTSALRVGSHSIGAQYSGDSVFADSGKSIFYEVFRGLTATTISGPELVLNGTTVRFTAVVRPIPGSTLIPTGTVSFTILNHERICTDVSLNTSGFAVCDIPFNVTGDFMIQTVYSGDANFESIDRGTVAQKSVRVIDNTPPGNNLTLQSGNYRVTFGQVTSSGNTTFTPITPSSAGSAPPGYIILNNEPAYDITTTASYTPPVTVCLRPSSINDQATFSRVRILHGEGGQLIDRTILPPDTPAPDFATRTVCARVNSLSPFALALAPVGPTAATVAVSGHVTSPLGRGITGVNLSLTDSQGNTRTTVSIAGGYYQFTDVQVGETYILSATGKRFTFSQPVQVLNINEETSQVNFVANSEKRMRMLF